MLSRGNFSPVLSVIDQPSREPKRKRQKMVYETFSHHDVIEEKDLWVVEKKEKYITTNFFEFLNRYFLSVEQLEDMKKDFNILKEQQETAINSFQAELERLKQVIVSLQKES